MNATVTSASRTVAAQTSGSMSGFTPRMLYSDPGRAKGRRSSPSARSGPSSSDYASATPSSVPIPNVTAAAATPMASWRSPARNAD